MSCGVSSLLTRVGGGQQSTLHHGQGARGLVEQAVGSPVKESKQWRPIYFNTGEEQCQPIYGEGLGIRLYGSRRYTLAISTLEVYTASESPRTDTRQTPQSSSLRSACIR